MTLTNAKHTLSRYVWNEKTFTIDEDTILNIAVKKKYKVSSEILNKTQCRSEIFEFII